MGNKLYDVGGIYKQSSEIFDYLSNKFTLIKPFPLNYSLNDSDSKITFFRVKDNIIVKYDSEDKENDNIYIYDTKKDKWSSKCVEYLKENNCEVLYI